MKNGTPMTDTPSGRARPHSADLVVVLLATFDGALYLRKQLDSVADQTHKQWRLVVSDDGSSDDTMQVVRRFAEEHAGKVTILQEDPLGSARDNFLRLLKKSGPAAYFAFCDQDDVWRLDKLELLVQQCRRVEAERASTPCLVYSDLTVVDSQLQLLNDSFLKQIRTNPEGITYKNLLAENSIPGCSMLINAALADVLRTYDFDTSKVIMHDWWLALVAATLGTISYVPTSLVSYRQHATNTLGSVNRSGLAFVLSKFLQANNSATLQTYEQAAAFVDAYRDILDPKICSDIEGFASLPSRSKYARIRMVLKNRTLKQGLSRRIYQLMRA